MNKNISTAAPTGPAQAAEEAAPPWAADSWGLSGPGAAAAGLGFAYSGQLVVVDKAFDIPVTPALADDLREALADDDAPEQTLYEFDGRRRARVRVVVVNRGRAAFELLEELTGRDYPGPGLSGQQAVTAIPREWSQSTEEATGLIVACRQWPGRLEASLRETADDTWEIRVWRWEAADGLGFESLLRHEAPSIGAALKAVQRAVQAAREGPKAVWEKQAGYTAPNGAVVSQQEYAKLGDRHVWVGAIKYPDGHWEAFGGDDTEADGCHVRSNSYNKVGCSCGQAARAAIKELKAELGAKVVRAYNRAAARAAREAGR